MFARRTLFAWIGLAAGLCPTTPAAGVDLLPQQALRTLGAQRYWSARLPLEADDLVVRTVLLDENLYALTLKNRVYAVHALTGILRWSDVLADEGKRIRGPAHAREFVFFTAPGTVRVLNRVTGEPMEETRRFNAVIIEVAHDTARLSIGKLHGIRLGDRLHVYEPALYGEDLSQPLARVEVVSVDWRSSEGRLTRFPGMRKARPGDRVTETLDLPKGEVKLPFAAASAAVADDEVLYVGAANERFYAFEIMTGVQRWQLSTPHTVSATPIIMNDALFLAGQDGRVVACTKQRDAAHATPRALWTFDTEGAIFTDLRVDDARVYVTSSDRSLYALDQATGKRRWRHRFGSPQTTAPVVAEERLFQTTPDEGLYVLSTETGEVLWRRPAGGALLAQFADHALIFDADGTRSLMKIDAATGSEKASVDAGAIDFAAADQADQIILLSNRLGEMMCLRPKDAPPLRPERLAQVLRDDRKIAAAKEIDRERAEAAGKEVEGQATGPDPFDEFETDFLGNRSTARPAGGSGLVDVGKVRADEQDKAEADEEEPEEDDEEADDEDDEDDEEEDDGG